MWNKANLDFSINGLAENLLEDVTSKNPDIQEAAAKALASLLSQLENNSINSIVKKLLNIYQDKLTVKICGKPEMLLRMCLTSHTNLTSI